MSTWPGLSSSVVSRKLAVADLDVHILEAGRSEHAKSSGRLVLLLHGFPELAYSWRRILPPLAQAGFHAVAPDLRGYGRTRRRTPTSTNDKASHSRDPQHDRMRYEDDLAPFRMLNLVADVVGLVRALGYNQAEAVVGHDFGSPLAGYCALLRPDVFRSLVMMSAPFTGVPYVPSPAGGGAVRSPAQVIEADLRSLTPPRKHYTVYFSSPHANSDMLKAPCGLFAFLRAYFHMKSGDWHQNTPYPLLSRSAAALAGLPYYYVMLADETMPQSVCTHNASTATPAVESSENERRWLPDAELRVYADEFGATGFQGGLNYYRCMTDLAWSADLRAFVGKKVEVRAMFLAGKQDWGVYQMPGAVDAMRDLCEKMKEEDFVLVEGAGHWVQQEAHEAVVENLLRFLVASIKS